MARVCVLCMCVAAVGDDTVLRVYDPKKPK